MSRREVLDTADVDLPMLVWNSVPADVEPYPEWRTFWYVELLNYEIGNGGLVQYFWNNEGTFNQETEIALTEMGATKQLALFRRAMKLWQQERARHPDLWSHSSPDQLSEKLYGSSELPALDDEWVASPIEPIESAYVRRHIDAFAHD